MGRDDKLPIKMLQDRLLVHIERPRASAARRAASSSRPRRSSASA